VIQALTRRDALVRTGLLALAGALAPLPRAAERLGLLGAASAAGDEVIRDTLNGMVAYAVPGSDRYSLAQGESSSEPGGVDARGGEGLRATLEVLGPGILDAAVSVLNAVAGAVAPGAAAGGFAAPFAALSSADKARALELLAASDDPSLQTLAGNLPALAAFVSYSEQGVLDAGGQLTGVPVGWRISGYRGVADGRAEHRGYYQGRRAARRRTTGA
jgi:hypothetical protein